MDVKHYGGLIETMYSQFPEEEIPENIKKYKERIDGLFLCKSKRELRRNLQTFSEEERNYLSCTYLDDFFKIKKRNIENIITENICDEVMRFYLKMFTKNKYVNVLFLAAKHGKKFATNFLLENYNYEESDKNFALIKASAQGHLSIVNILLEKGANIHAWDNYAYAIAMQHGYVNVANKLIEAGAERE